MSCNKCCHSQTYTCMICFNYKVKYISTTNFDQKDSHSYKYIKIPNFCLLFHTRCHQLLLSALALAGHKAFWHPSSNASCDVSIVLFHVLLVDAPYCIYPIDCMVYLLPPTIRHSCLCRSVSAHVQWRTENKPWVRDLWWPPRLSKPPPDCHLASKLKLGRAHNFICESLEEVM